MRELLRNFRVSAWFGGGTIGARAGVEPMGLDVAAPILNLAAWAGSEVADKAGMAAKLARQFMSNMIVDISRLA